MPSRFSVSQAWNSPTADRATFAGGRSSGWCVSSCPTRSSYQAMVPGRRDLPKGVAVAHPVSGHQVPERQHGQLAPGIREVLPGERQERRYPGQLRPEPDALLLPERELVEGEPLHGVHVGPGIPRPGTAHPEVVVEAVQPRPHQEVVHLLRNRPAGRVDRPETVRETVEPGPLPLDGLRAVVGEAVLHGRADRTRRTRGGA